jgi:hypothetical protein
MLPKVQFLLPKTQAAFGPKTWFIMSEHTKETNRNEDPWPLEGEFGQVTLRMKVVPGFHPLILT